MNWNKEKVVTHLISKTKLAIKLFRYHIRASDYSKLPKPYCNSKSIVNIPNTDKCYFLRCILAHKYHVDSYLERVSHYAKRFHEPNQGDIQFPINIPYTNFRIIE